MHEGCDIDCGITSSADLFKSERALQIQKDARPGGRAGIRISRRTSPCQTHSRT